MIEDDGMKMRIEEEEKRKATGGEDKVFIYEYLVPGRQRKSVGRDWQTL
jgi:hypothetical protein